MSEEIENNPEATTETKAEVAPGKKKPSPIGRVLFLIITAFCFAYLYYRLNGAAAREGLSLVEYMTQVFATVDWIPWLALMVCYSLFYFAIDTLVVTKALNWFVADIKYKDIMPIRASSYIISIFNEQIGKGAMAYYLNKRDKIPGWEVGSVMLFVMFCEIYYLLVWATIGFAVGGDSLPDVFGLVPYIAAVATVFLVLWIAYFRGAILPKNNFREKIVFHAFRQAKPWHYGAFFLLRSPALLAAIVVYTIALNLFGVEASLMTLLPFLPVIFFAAAVPTPMRAAAITFWVILFPENEGQMAAFGFVQHNFFILFNAAIGLVFWRKAQRDLFGK
ncbi:MAG: hypothetical protein OSB11_00845 [Gammaproteobacteria bacterium]|jgi:hypothetical protein|nr:hypothetical protein [Gammaproteobacteria bacterium]